MPLGSSVKARWTPFDHPDVIAGQGTCGLEIINQVRDLGLELDILVSCASGGGLAAGIGLALEALSPKTQLIGAEPVSHDDLARSLALGHRVANEPGTRTIQDALMTQIPGELTFPILARIGTKGVAVSDDEVLHAMAFAFKYLRIVLEPGGAAALAAVLSGKVAAKGQVIAVTGSGGNVDPEIFMRALAIRV